MNTQINLKELERKAFRSTFQDGLWDIYLGLIVLSMGIFLMRPEEGYGPGNILIMLVCVGFAYLVFWTGKKYITLPRLGNVIFGEARKKRKTTLAILLGILVLANGILVGLTTAGWLNPHVGGWIRSTLGGSLERVVVAAIGAFFVGVAMILMAYFNDFSRGYYLAFLLSLAVFLMILVNRPVYMAILSAFIILPGLFFLIRFLRKYPLPNRENLP